VLSELSFADRADQIVRQLEDELVGRKNRAKSFESERKRLESERDSFIESIAHLQAMATDGRSRKQLIEDIVKRIDERQRQLDELVKKELSPFEIVLTTSEVEMVREFLADLGSRWDEIPNEMRNNFLHIVLDRILVQEADNHFHVQIIWRSGFTQNLVVFRPAICLRKNAWSEEEESLILEHYATASREEFAQMLPDRPWHDIRRRANQLGVQRGWPDRTGTSNPHWTTEEDQVLRDYDESVIAYSEMLDALHHRSPAAIRRRANILGIDLKRQRIVWRFVDTFHDTAPSRGGRRAGRSGAPAQGSGRA
jgi:hypothetical protein